MRSFIFLLIALLSFESHAQQVVELCEDSQRTFTYSSGASDAGAWEWYLDGNLISTESSVTVTWTDPGIYEMFATFVSSCEAEPREFTVEVRECPISTVFFPNTFTPNRDELNDLWGPVTSNIEEIEWTIWNRWGEKIFHARDLNTKWDGNKKSATVPNGVYVYQAKWKNVRGFSESAIGHVTVIQ
jgi:gliding motility-associated-like protein